MKMRAKFTVPQLDIDGYLDALRQEMFDAMLLGIYAYLDTVTGIVPVWSGASRATFLHLAREVGYPLSAAPVTGAPTRVSLGISHSSGEFKNELQDLKIEFTYSTDLPWLVYNEYHNANITPDPGLISGLIQPGPYGFQEAGKEAFEKHLANAFPDISRFITVKTIEVR